MGLKRRNHTSYGKAAFVTASRLRLAAAVAILLVVFSPFAIPAWGGIASLSISPTGDTSFGLMGIAMEDVEGLQVTITYDVSTMTDVSVSPTGIIAGAKYTTAVSEGTVRISATENAAVDGSGYIVMLDYARVSDNTPGRITSASVYVTDKHGHESSVPVVIQNPLPQETDTLPTGSQAGQEKKVDPPTGGAPVAAETVREGGSSGRTTPAAPGRGYGGEGEGAYKTPAVSGQGTDTTPHAEVRSFFAYKSALTRIREFTGEKSEKNILPFLTGDRDGPFRQEPFVALSDGKSSVRIIMDLDIKGGKGPIFVLRGAQFRALNPQGGSWTLEVVPVQGVMEASVTAMYDDRIVEFPFVLAPPLATYLKSRTHFQREYVDTYVALVNRLANGGGKQ